MPWWGFEGSACTGSEPTSASPEPYAVTLRSGQLEPEGWQTEVLLRSDAIYSQWRECSALRSFLTLVQMLIQWLEVLNNLTLNSRKKCGMPSVRYVSVVERKVFLNFQMLVYFLLL